MGVITAPVCGSAGWPAWMTRVAKRGGRAGFFMAPLPGPLPEWRGRTLSFQLPSQMVQEVDAGDEAVELAALGNDGDVVAVEDRHHLLDGLVRRERLELGGHVLAHHVA